MRDHIKGGTVIALTGPLGSGKTIFAKGIAEILEIGEEITSPTYTIISEYEGTHSFYHIDLYRTENIPEIENLGIEDFLYGDGVTVIEWSEKASPLLPEESIFVEIRINPDGSRQIIIEGIDL